ncbi:antibiotic biosynthesis monooxygenase [Pseudoxanthomonas yeongjuensis]|uniref:antibiotic biosynthesis monooxygenase family protein n=1 Tax=Pseudoxanthomonas yeongjuensis TaxID=377616 RepID=UPI00139207C7|nr:antibiotic biosynthesis monooxygenase [Pseudoxanthomonas yeongjuensis]KAF1713767.1 antibiotic biosynthesis monooxygenase [Pseudoxanthomonas yeongjuensis]
MIARLWRGVTLAEKSEAYLAFLQARAVPDYRAIPGNLSVDILHRTVGAITHYLIVTRWESREAIAAFAGNDIAQAKYYREDVDFLLEFEPTVEHYEVS